MFCVLCGHDVYFLQVGSQRKVRGMVPVWFPILVEGGGSGKTIVVFKLILSFL